MHELGADGRLDLYVYNEATAWTLSSRRLIEENPVAEDQPWDAATAQGRLLAQSLYQDDSFHVRVVLGELDEDEEEAWVGRASWWLQVPDGVLVIAAGGEFSWGWSEDPDEDEFVHQVAVPPGDYRVDLYTTLTGVNGLSALRRLEHDEALGAWWRRTRPEDPMPAWLQFLLLDGLAEDPGHEDEWQGWATARHQAVMRSVEEGAWIDWVVQLRPLAGDPPKQPPELDEGCFSEPELRIPRRCPRGLCGDPVNAEDTEAEPPAEPVDVIERLAGQEPLPIEEGDCVLAADEVEIAARLAWFANRDVDGEVLLDGPELGNWVERHMPTDDVFLRTARDGRFRVGFSDNAAVHDLLHRLRRLGPAFTALPDGATLELIASAGDAQRIGDLRLAGTCHGGNWRIERAWPAVDAATLRAALSLAREADRKTIRAGDDDELQRVLDRWREEGLSRTSPLEVRGLDVGHDEGGQFSYIVAAAVFAVRFGDTWPCPDAEDPMAEFELDSSVDLFTALAEGAVPLTDALHEAESGRTYYDIPEEDLPADVLQTTGPLRNAFADAGAVPVGDLICSFSPTVVIRGVAEKQARWYGTIMIAPYVGVVTEAYTRFKDGSSITSTTNTMPGGSVAGSGIHWNLLPETTNPQELAASHLAVVEAHAKANKTAVVLVRQNLLGLCEAIEEFLIRRAG